MDYEQLKHFRNTRNHFSKFTGIETVEIRKGYSKCMLDLRGEHFNVVNSAHGGALYTLMDTAGGAAATSYGDRVTTLSSSVEFLNPVLEPHRIYGIGRVIKNGRSITVVDVRIVDDEGRNYTKGTFTYYNLDLDRKDKPNE